MPKNTSEDLPEQLARQEFGKFFRESRTAMMLVDDDRRYLAVNAATCRLLQVEAAAIIGLRIEDLTPAEDRARVPALWEQFLSEGMLEGSYVLMRPGDGRRLQVNFSATADLATGMHLSLLAPTGKQGPSEEPPVAAERGGPISPRELEVLRLVALGGSNGEIGSQLAISSETVRNHIRNARDKLGAKTKSHAVALAFQRGLFER